MPEGEYIRLDAALKLHGLVSTGGEAKLAIQGGEVTVNGELCAARGRKLHGGEEIAYRERRFTVGEPGKW